jgi:2-keto-4-pentenoate hydratase/2-oxohepta-3-ene-1,7-dioic acid hydratase in catechol pathway
MKLARFSYEGRTRVGVVDGQTIADVGTADPALPTDVGALVDPAGLARVRALVDGAPKLALDVVRLEATIARTPMFLAAGLNYHAHIVESTMAKPDAPVIFNKQITCITGPFDPIEVPTVAPDLVDYEGELGLVIGTACRAVPLERAHEVVAGYLVVNDVSVRDWQKASPTMTMGKSWDTHGPIGPWMVTADEIGDPHDLTIKTWVDGDLRQDASTSLMILNCWELIAHISTAFTLLPGTIIATGTPAGVGYARKPPATLHPGSTVRVEIDRIGVIDNPVVAQPQPPRPLANW